MTRMARGGAEQQYEELFTYACPKFINAAPPTLDAPSTNTNQVGPPARGRLSGESIRCGLHSCCQGWLLAAAESINQSELPSQTKPQAATPCIAQSRPAQEVYRLQLRCFLGLIMEQRHLPALKLLLKLYTTISLPKLAGLMDMDEASLRAQLLLLKARLARSLLAQKPSPCSRPTADLVQPVACCLAHCGVLAARLAH